MFTWSQNIVTCLILYAIPTVAYVYTNVSGPKSENTVFCLFWMTQCFRNIAKLAILSEELHIVSNRCSVWTRRGHTDWTLFETL